MDSGSMPASGTTVVWTNRYNNAGTGAILTEKILTPATVSGPKFGLLFSLPVDGTVQAQPLYIPGLSVNGAQHNVVFVATENNTVYAYDADVSGPALWSRSMGTAFKTGNPDGTAPVFGCADLYPVVGINSTPVIDTNTGTMYVVAKTSVGGTAHQFLHALDIKTGADRTGSPTEITASVPGTGEGNVGGTLSFDPRVNLQRAGLLLQNNVVYIAWASHCDLHPYHGWVMAYDAATLAQKGVYNDTPNGAAGGIWQSGMGLTSDGTGVYFVSGNGDFDPNGGNGAGANKGMSVGRLTLGTGGFTLADSFTVYNATALNAGDNDLTSSAVIAPGTNYLYMSGKDSHLRVLNRSNLGGFNHAPGAGSDSQIPQDIYMGGGHLHGGPVVWQGSTPTLFAWNEGHQLQAYAMQAGTAQNPALNGRLPTAPTKTANVGYITPHPGAIITVSSNGTMPGTGVVWGTTLPQPAQPYAYDAAWHHIVPGILYAMDAEDITKNLWNSDKNPADSLGLFAKFSPPVVADGKVYVGTATTTNMVRVYGLKP
ncbi:MAG: hypothetical protein M3O36_00470 [Myxococcota bacterium]|nr:hypothetical protein [Myxococcota bacterium]